MKILHKLMNRYRSIPTAAKASVWFAICSIVQKGIAFITVPIFTRLLTTEEYGLFNVFQSWSGIISIFATLNLSAGVFNNGMLKYKDSRPEYTSSMQGLSTMITFVLFILYSAFHSIIDEYSGLNMNLFILMFVSFLFSPALSFWSAKQRFDYKYAALIVITLIIAIVTPVSGIILIKILPYKAEARIYTSVLISAFVGLLMYIYNAYRGKKLFIKEYWIFALAFNLPLIPHYLSTMVLNQADRIMINNMCGTDKAGIYSVAYSLSMVMTLITSSINNSFIPWTYKSMSARRYKEIGRISNYVLLLIFAVTVAAILFAPEAMKIIAPVEYYEAIWVIPPVAVSVFFMFLYTLFGNIEFYFEKTKYVMMASITGAILNVILNYIFINLFGYLAAGYTTLVCYIAFCFAHYVFMKKCIKDEIPEAKIYNMRFILCISMLLLIVSALAMCLYNHVVIRYTILLLTSVVVFIKRKMIIEILVKIRSKA